MGDFDQVGMIGAQAHAAQLATFERTLAPRQLTQRSKSRGRLCELSGTHIFELMASTFTTSLHRSAPGGSRATVNPAGPGINLSNATNPEAGFSSRPSITRKDKSGAASYIAPS